MRSINTISRSSYIKALKPFFDAVGLDADLVYNQGFVHTAERITGFAAVRPEDAPDDGWVSIGDVPEVAERGWPFTIEIEDLD